MTVEKKIAKYMLVAMGVIIVLVLIAQVVGPMIYSAGMRSDKELGLLAKIAVSFSYLLRKYVFLILVSLLFLWGLLFWVSMLVDCFKRNFVKDIDKVIWFLVIFFFNLVGALVYYFAVKKKA